MDWNGHGFVDARSPNVGPESYLGGVTAHGTASAWAVGGASGKPLILRWNGTTWTRSKAPGKGILNAVAASSPKNAWAVGDNGDNALILHWDGASWSPAKP
jgi:hypothetical protein